MGSRWLYMLPAILLSVLAVVLALVGLARMPDPAQSAQQAPGTVIQVVSETDREESLAHEYWVATREMPVGTVMVEEDLAHIRVNVPLAGAVPGDSSMAGQLLRRNLRKGEVLSRSHLEAGNLLARAVPAGYRAFAIAVDDVVAAGGLLKPGDLVDVLAAFRSGQDAQPTAMILLSSIEVLAVHGQLEDAPAQEAQPQQRSGRNSTAVLAVPREDLTKLLLASANGDLRLAVAGEARFDAGKDAPADATGQPDVIKFDSLFPQRQRAAPAAPGERVEVIEGGRTRSTYVH